jgi:hypothetical protein
MTKVCRGCQRIDKQTDALKKADMLDRHQCKANYQGSAPSMETEGIKRIFGRSEETRKLQYTEYFGDGDSKAYNEVENAYENIHVEKKECACRSCPEASWDGTMETEERNERMCWSLVHMMQLPTSILVRTIF